MANAVSGVRRIVVLVSGISVLGLTSLAAVQAQPPPSPSNPDVLVANYRVENTFGVNPIGVRAWVGITNQWR